MGMGGLARFSRSLAIGARLATSRFPSATLAIIVLSALANLAIRNVYPIPEAELLRLVLALQAAAAASVCVRLAAESRRLPPVLQSVLPPGAALLAGVPVWATGSLWLLAPPSRLLPSSAARTMRVSGISRSGPRSA
jgi:hypothetical protein